MLHSTLARIALSRTPTHSWRWASVARPPGDVNGTPTHAPYSGKVGGNPRAQRRFEVRQERTREHECEG
jgi:hypothetical protein